MQLKVLDLRGQLMGRPLAGTGDFAYRDGLLTFSDVALRAGPNRLRADGSVGERLAGGFDLDAPDLSVLWPGLTGSLDAHATLAGTRTQPVVDLDAHGRSLALSGNSVEALEMRARIDRNKRVDAELSARGIESAENAVGDLEATLKGTLDAHSLSAHLSGGVIDAQLASTGRWNGTTLQHRIESAAVAAPALGSWRLSGEPAFAWQADSAPWSATTAGNRRRHRSA